MRPGSAAKPFLAPKLQGSTKALANNTGIRFNTDIAKLLQTSRILNSDKSITGAIRRTQWSYNKLVRRMIFPPESIVKARRALFEQMETGTLVREQAFQRALELDPYDAVSLMILSEERYEVGDLAGAAEYCWRAVSADPRRFEPWFKLAACVPGESQAFRDGLRELGAWKALRDPEGVERFEEALKNKPAAAAFPSGEAALVMAAEGWRAEPPLVEERCAHALPESRPPDPCPTPRRPSPADRLPADKGAMTG